jgi:hypothetical protein
MMPLRYQELIVLFAGDACIYATNRNVVFSAKRNAASLQ